MYQVGLIHKEGSGALALHPAFCPFPPPCSRLLALAKVHPTASFNEFVSPELRPVWGLHWSEMLTFGALEEMPSQKPKSADAAKLIEASLSVPSPPESAR